MYFIKLLIFINGFGNAALAAQEAERSYCESPYNIATRIEICPDNQFFAVAADQCISRFQQEVNSVTAKLSGNFAEHEKKAVSAQDSKQRNNSKNLYNTDHDLKQLLANAKQIKKDLYLYMTTIILPGRPSLEMLTQYNIYDILAQNPCYRENRVKIETHRNWITQKISELKLTDATVNRMNYKTVRHIDHLRGNRGTGEAAAKSYGSGSGKRVSASNTTKASSTITGKIKNENLR